MNINSIIFLKTQRIILLIQYLASKDFAKAMMKRTLNCEFVYFLCLLNIYKALKIFAFEMFMEFAVKSFAKPKQKHRKKQIESNLFYWLLK